MKKGTRSIVLPTGENLPFISTQRKGENTKGGKKSFQREKKYPKYSSEKKKKKCSKGAILT